MIQYTRQDAQDYLLAQWWAEITVDGSRDQLFTPPNTLGQMLAYFQREDVHLVYETDGRGVWFAMWFTPLFSGMSASMWCRTDRRGKLSQLRAAERGYSLALDAVPVLLGLTTQEKLLKEHQRLGYTIVGTVPKLVNGQDAWIVALTREGWAGRKARRSERREAVVG